MDHPDVRKRDVDKNIGKKIFFSLVYLFALIGFFLLSGYAAVRLGLTREKGVVDMQRANFLGALQDYRDDAAWSKSEEWSVLKQAIVRDAASINRAAKDARTDARLIVAELVPEQLRLFHDNREVFKQFFAPLKILGNQSQFSWGVMGIKREAAIAIEERLRDSSSPYYLGPEYENVLDFKTADQGKERFLRISDEKDRYYAYLYTAIFLREVIQQWKMAGYDISARPEILATLYNIGFDRSQPNSDPHSGGAEIEIGGKTYSFGTLAADFYYSDQLREYFP